MDNAGTRTEPTADRSLLLPPVLEPLPRGRRLRGHARAPAGGVGLQSAALGQASHLSFACTGHYPGFPGQAQVNGGRGTDLVYQAELYRR